jgi:hypothetical protein
MMHCVDTGRVGRTAAVAVALAIPLAGCATPYLHDASVQAQTTAVSDAWSKIDNSTYFADLRKSFVALEADEDAALTRSLQATRDRNLVAYIDPSEPPNSYHPEPLARGVNALCKDVNKRVAELSKGPLADAGTHCSVLADDDLATIRSRLPQKIVVARATLRAAQQERADAVEQFTESRDAWRKAHPSNKKDGGVMEPDLPLDCDKIAANPSGADQAVPKDYPIDHYRVLVEACLGGGGKVGVIGALQALGRGGELQTTAGVTDQSIIGGIFKRAVEAQQEADKSAAAAAKLDAGLKVLQKKINDIHSSSAEFADALKEVKDTLADAPAAAKLVGAEKLAVILQDALKAELSSAENKTDAAAPAAAETPSTTTKRTQAIEELAAAGATLADAIRVNDPDQRKNALLIALAAQRQQVDMLRLEAKRETDRLQIINAELLGGLTELALLSEAQLFLTKVSPTDAGIATLGNNTAAQAALNRTALAWSEGRIPMNLARLRHIYLNRDYRIRIAEKTAENWRGLIKPAIDAMVAGGAGGVPPEVIGNLVGPPAAAAIIKGK